MLRFTITMPVPGFDMRGFWSIFTMPGHEEARGWRPQMIVAPPAPRSILPDHLRGWPITADLEQMRHHLRDPLTTGVMRR